jgi:hypothetical protein
MDLDKSAWRPESVAGPRARIAVAKRVYEDSSRQGQNRRFADQSPAMGQLAVWQRSMR